MKIEIDTKVDSKETIRKAIELLRSIVGESAYSNGPRNIFSDESSFGQSSSEKAEPSNNVFGGLFGVPYSQESSSYTETEEEKEEKEESVEIIPY